MEELHEFEEFSVCRSIGGDYYAETEDGTLVLLLSGSGSNDDVREEKWIESRDRTQGDFESAYPEILDPDQRD